VSDAFVLAAFSTDFGKKAEQSYKSLTREAYLGLLGDAGFPDGAAIESAWFSNTGLHRYGQASVGGQVLFTPLVREGLFPERVGMVNVHNACASGASAFRGAWLEVKSGAAQVALAIGVEKMVDPDRSPAETAEMFMGGIDRFDEHEWRDYYAAAGEEAGKPFDVPGDRSMFMDTYAMQAAWHMKRYGTTLRQLASSAAKTHNFGALNPRAQYRFEMSVDDVLADREVSYPLTRAMCAPIGDGAAGALLVSERRLRELPGEVRDRAVLVAATALSGGKYRDLDEPGLSRTAAQRAYRQAGIGPEAIDVAEVHDATAFCEIYQVEMLGFCEDGAGGDFVGRGETRLGGSLPVNTSGGLVSKGHPVGATGLSMVAELTQQLRGEAGDRQVPGARTALAENGGGVVGFDEAACAVTLLRSA